MTVIASGAWDDGGVWDDAGAWADDAALVATGITTGAPTLGAPALSIVVNLTANGITTGATTVGKPKLAEFWAWPFRPLPDSAEALSWATDVMQSGSSEMRVSLRPARQTLTFAYNLRDPKNARAEGILRAAPRGLFLVPIWAEGTNVGAVSAVAATISVDTSADYRAGHLAVVWGGCDDYVIREVASVGAGSITFVSAVGRAFTSARVMPLRRCFMGDGGLRSDRIRERGVSAAAISFVSIDEPPSAATPFAQYLGLDLVTKCGTVESLASSFVPSTAFVDSGLGPIALEALRDPIDARFTMVWRMPGLAKLWERRRWLHLIRGRDRAFWLTDWQRDLTLQAAIGPAATTILVAPVLPRLTDYVGRHIMIDDGTETPRQITAAAQSGLNHQLTIAALGRTVPTSARVSFLRKVRLDSDVVEFAHRQGFFSATRLPLIEVPE